MFNVQCSMFNEKIVTLRPNMSTFKELGLCAELLHAIEEQGYEHPMPEIGRASCRERV